MQNKIYLIDTEHVRRNIAFGNMMKIAVDPDTPLSKLVCNTDYREEQAWLPCSSATPSSCRMQILPPRKVSGFLFCAQTDEEIQTDSTHQMIENHTDARQTSITHSA